MKKVKKTVTQGKTIIARKRGVEKVSKPRSVLGRNQCSVKALAAVFSKCQPFVNIRGLLPVLQHFSVRKGEVRATDGVVGIVMSVETLGFPEATVNAEIITKLFASFADDDMARVVVAEGPKVEIQVRKYRGVFESYPSADFPVIEPPKSSQRIAMESWDWETVRKTHFCIPRDEARVALRGVRFDAEGLGCATDGIRMAWRSGRASLKQILIPSPLIERIVGWNEAPSAWAVDTQGRFCLFFPGAAVFCVQPAAEFPDTQKIREEFTEQTKGKPGFTVGDRTVLVAALQRGLLVVGDEPTARMRVTLKGQQIILDGSGLYGRMDEAVPVRRFGGLADMTIAINGRYLLEAVERCDEFVLLENALVAYAEKRAFGHVVMLLTGS